MGDQNIIVVFTDTMACLQFFMPANQYDSTSRIRVKGEKSLSPIYSLPTWDICVSQQMLDETTRVSQLVDMDRIAAFGRPLWTFSWINAKELKTEAYLIDLAKAKLTCCVNVQAVLNDQNRCKLFSLAVISCRCIVHLQPTSIQAANLVADFMAINLHVSEDRTQMFTTYSSEPILAEAAACLWHQKFKKVETETETTVFAQAIRNVTSCITNGIVDQGKTGELAGRLILQKAMDVAASKAKRNDLINYTNVVTVEEFLKVFLGNRNFERFCQQNRSKKDFERLLQGRACFSHFIQSTATTPDEKTGQKHNEEVLRNSKRYGATVCEMNHYGTDAEVAVFLKPENGTLVSNSTQNNAENDERERKLKEEENIPIS